MLEQFTEYCTKKHQKNRQRLEEFVRLYLEVVEKIGYDDDIIVCGEEIFPRYMYELSKDDSNIKSKFNTMCDILEYVISDRYRVERIREGNNNISMSVSLDYIQGKINVKIQDKGIVDSKIQSTIKEIGSILQVKGFSYEEFYEVVSNQKYLTVICSFNCK